MTETEARIRLLLVDDHGVVRAGLRLFLAGQPDLEVVGGRATGSAPSRRRGSSGLMWS